MTALDTPRPGSEPDPAAPASRGERLRTAVRIVVALVLSGLICMVVWLLRSRQLSSPIDIVGNPTFIDYDFQPLFLRYRLITYAFPAGVIVIYLLLAWRGPLRRQRPGAGGPVALVVEGAVAAAAASAGARLSVAGTAWRVLPPALFAGLVASAASSAEHPSVSWISLCVAIAYIVVVLGVAQAMAVSGRGPSLMRSWAADGYAAAVNAVAIMLVAFGGLWFVSQRTMVRFPSHSDRWQHWSWLPWWLAVVFVLVAFGWFARALRQGTSPESAEQRMRAVVLGAAAVFLVSAIIAPPLHVFFGFDDAQNLTGAAMLQRGLFPWRDFQFAHGLFPDALAALASFHVFQESTWGANAGLGLIFVPLTWVGMYLLAVWGARRRSLVPLGVLALAAWQQQPVDSRFIGFAPVLLLLGLALSRRSLRWTALLTVALFAQALVVPESTFQVVAVAAVLVLSDLVHRTPRQPLRNQFRRTACFVATGALLCILWAAFLLSQHALRGFISWFVVFGPGHDAEGAVKDFQIGTFNLDLYRFMTIVVVATVLVGAWRIYNRRAWTVRDWVTAAAAINAGLYGEQALGRFEMPHTQYSNAVGLLLIILTAGTVVPALDGYVRAGVRRVVDHAAVQRVLTHSVSVVLLLLVLGSTPKIVSHIWNVAGQTRVSRKHPVYQVAGLGYTQRNIVRPGELADLKKVLDTYAPKDAPFFDMTNAPGYFYFLFKQRPATVFTNISQAIPENSQRMLISQLRKSRPPLVAFSSVTIGEPTWAWEVQNEVRHFLVSQYVLDHYKPLLSSQGVLFLLRDDLVRSKPPVPKLAQPAKTTGLYASQATCSWGDSANFLTSPATGNSVTVQGHPEPGFQQVGVSGWSFDEAADKRVKHVVILTGRRVAAIAYVGFPTPNAFAATHERHAHNAGFDVDFFAHDGPVSVYALRDGKLHELDTTQGGAPKNLKRIRVPGKGVLPVVKGKFGQMTGLVESPVSVKKFDLPRSASLSNYQLVTFKTAQKFGTTAHLMLSDGNAFLNNPATPAPPIQLPASTKTFLNPSLYKLDNAITADMLPRFGTQMSVRVGSCLAWHGYRSHALYVAQYGGAPVQSLTLSDTTQ
jgi:hypothetical protein